MLSIAAEKKEFDEWEAEKLQMRQALYKKVDWEAQHEALAKEHSQVCNKIRPPGGEKNNQLEDDRCPLCGKAKEASSHFLRC